MALKQLGQTRPPTAGTFVSIYSPGTGITASSLVLTIANTSGADTTYRIAQDDNGTTYDETTALAWDVAILADTVVKVNVGPMADSSGNLAVTSGANNALTFTLHGIETC
jgi:hypothetical protein